MQQPIEKCEASMEVYGKKSHSEMCTRTQEANDEEEAK